MNPVIKRINREYIVLGRNMDRALNDTFKSTGILEDADGFGLKLLYIQTPSLVKLSPRLCSAVICVF